jgi:hypothetical protein
MDVVSWTSGVRAIVEPTAVRRTKNEREKLKGSFLRTPNPFSVPPTPLSQLRIFFDTKFSPPYFLLCSYS